MRQFQRRVGHVPPGPPEHGPGRDDLRHPAVDQRDPEHQGRQEHERALLNAETGGFPQKS